MSTSLQGTIEITLSGHDFVLLPGRAMLRPQTGELLVADVHLGKGDALRRAGRPVPAGATSRDLEHLRTLMSLTGARVLTVLGDLLHHEQTGECPVAMMLTEWLGQAHEWRCRLVLGNHDRHARVLLESLRDRGLIELLEAGTEVEGVTYMHEPPDDARACAPWLGGHLHPGTKLKGGVDQLRVPVFWQLGESGIVLPAVGCTTGMKPIGPASSDRVFSAGPTRVIEVPTARGHSVAMRRPGAHGQVNWR